MPRTSHLGGLSLAGSRPPTFSLGGRAVSSAALTPTQALVRSFQAQPGLVDALLVFDPAHYTTPGSTPGHLVDALGGDISYDAPNTQATPAAVQDASGYYYALADGVDDTLIASAAQTVAWYCAVFRSPPGQTTWSNYGPVIETTITDSAYDLGYFSPGGTSFLYNPRSVRRDGIDLPDRPYNLAPITDWMVASIFTAQPTATSVLQIAGLYGGNFTTIHLAALAIRYTDPTADQQSAIEAKLTPVQQALLASA